MFVLYRGRYPAIMCPVTGEVVVAFSANAAGFSKCVAIIREVRAELVELGMISEVRS